MKKQPLPPPISTRPAPPKAQVAVVHNAKDDFEHWLTYTGYRTLEPWVVQLLEQAYTAGAEPKNSSAIAASIQKKSDDYLKPYASTDTMDRKTKDARIAALEAQLAERQWHPIETAPKDGSYVLLSNRASAGMYIGCWVASMSEWIDEIGNWLDPTDWQSLPPPPKEAP